MTNETTTASTPRMRFREMMRGDILVAARSILETGGFTALSMRSLAEAVGVRAPTLYDYFASKEEVLNAIYLEAASTMRDYFTDHVAGSGPGIPRLIAMGLSYRDFAILNPTMFQLVFSRVDSSFIPGPEQMEIAKGLFDALHSEVVTAIELGQIEPGDPDAISVTLWAMVHGLATLQLDGHVDKCAPGGSEHVVVAAIATLFQGLMPRAEFDPSFISCPFPKTPAAVVGE
ncbi:MAG: TetR/AcrR family transcriptional regulator [Thermomicrobiales bacterium]